MPRVTQINQSLPLSQGNGVKDLSAQLRWNMAQQEAGNENAESCHNLANTDKCSLKESNNRKRKSLEKKQDQHF